MQSDYSVNTVSTSSSKGLNEPFSGSPTGQPNAVDFWETARSLGLPAALWRLPNQQDKHLIVSFDEVLPRVAADLEELPAGFLISPFYSHADSPSTELGSSDHSDGANSTLSNQALFLRADIQTVFFQNNAFEPDQLAIRHTATGELADRFWHQLAMCADQAGNPDSTLNKPVTLPDSEAQAAYVQNVAEAVSALQQGAFRKVVLSRTKRVQFADAPNAVALFDKLCQTYPTAFVSAVAIPEKGQIWISATPERLVSVDATGIFQTASLAGTQSAFEPDGTPKRPPQAMWSQKEIEEQALVSRYIIECFKKIRLREYVEEGPKTIVAGNLMHLSTCFTVDTHAVRYPQLGTVMLRLLHPTSAVCGTPRNIAFDFIRQHETHDREFYSGFLGPIHMDTTHTGQTIAGAASNLFVHIRCMKLEGKLATLYAGAGLTEDSVPESEWQETEMKCQTLLAVISNP